MKDINFKSLEIVQEFACLCFNFALVVAPVAGNAVAATAAAAAVGALHS